MILIIDNYDSFTYNLYQIVSQVDDDIRVIRNDKTTIEAIETMSPSAIILSPGPGRPEDAGICLELIHHFSGKIPILGVCLGHQAIAEAFGGKVIQSKQIIHGKASPVFHNRQHLFEEVPMPFPAARYHSLIVEKESLPSILSIEAQTNDDIIMGIKHKNHLTFGVQFHPESILTESGKQIIQNFLNHCNLNATKQRKSC